MENDLGGVFDGGSNTFSFSAWIYPYDTEMNAESGALVYHKDTFGNTNFSLRTNSDGNLEVFIKNLCGGNELVIGNGELQPGDWHHIAMTYELGIVSVFLDENIYENQTCGYSLTEINEGILSFTLDKIFNWMYRKPALRKNKEIQQKVDKLNKGLKELEKSLNDELKRTVGKDYKPIKVKPYKLK